MQMFVIWQSLSMPQTDRGHTPEDRLALLQPSLVQLLQQVAVLTPSMPAFRTACEGHDPQVAMFACLITMARACGAVVHLKWHVSGTALQRWKPMATSTGSSRSSRSRSSSSAAGPSVQQSALVLNAEVSMCRMHPCLGRERVFWGCHSCCVSAMDVACPPAAVLYKSNHHNVTCNP